jgi:hypothetical protein
MRKVLFSLVMSFAAITAFSQDELDENKMVGFACFYEGRETKVVSKFKRMLKLHRYRSMKLKLQSENAAERFMAVLCLERLNAIGRLNVSEEEQALMGKIRISTEPVSVCSGCFPNPGVELRRAFDATTLWGATEWLDSTVGKQD